MTLFNNKYRVESTRLKGWDYTSSGLYYVTICTYKMKMYFGNIEKGKVILSKEGEIVYDEWNKTPGLRNNVVLDEYIVMPNHFHGIIGLEKIDENLKSETCQRHVSTEAKLIKDSLGSIINQFKGKCTKEIHKFNNVFKWQGRFHDRIIRNEQELDNIRAYIHYNPMKWSEDEFYIE